MYGMLGNYFCVVSSWMKGRVSYKLVLNGKGYFIIFLIICYEIYLSYGYGIFRL